MEQDKRIKAMPEVTQGLIVPDAEYFETKARQWFRRAEEVTDDAAAKSLRELAWEFEKRARALKNDN